MVAVNVRLLLLLQYRNILLLCQNARKRKRRCWVRPLWQKRKEQGIFHNLVQEMQLFDHFMYFKYFRMTPATFEKLLRFVAPEITKIKTNFREPLPPALKLSDSVWILGIGEILPLLLFSYRIALTSL